MCASFPSTKIITNSPTNGEKMKKKKNRDSFEMNSTPNCENENAIKKIDRRMSWKYEQQYLPKMLMIVIINTKPIRRSHCSSIEISIANLANYPGKKS
jgi:hypothetical protein